MSLWDWAVGIYQLPDVADACLALQDSHGQSVSLLLWSIWASPDAQTLEKGATFAREWDRAVLRSLRDVRRWLKTAHPMVDDTGRSELREEVVTAELLAERVLLETLEQLAARSPDDPLRSLTAASKVWGPAAPFDALQRLAVAVS